MKQQKFYSLKQTCRIIGVKPYILKHWEKKLGFNPDKNSAGRRIYTEKDIEKFALIRHLLYRELYTIEGAKRKLDKLRRLPTTKSNKRPKEKNILLILKKDLIDLKTQLLATETNEVGSKD